MPKVAVIGAGIAGLAFTHRLSETDRTSQVTLFEAGPRAGGTIETERRDGYVLEKGPDSFISEKPWGLELAKRLGLESEIINTENENRRSLILRNGRLVDVPQGFYLMAPTEIKQFLKSPLFSPAGKLRMMMEPLIPAKKKAEDESVAGFIRRRFGRECLERAGQPMLAGIYTGDPEKLSMLATMPRFIELEKKYKSVIRGLMGRIPQSSGPRYSLFLSFRAGMETLVKALLTRIPENTLRLNTAVEAVRRDHGDKFWNVHLADGRIESFDRVVLALPAHAAATLVSEVSPSLYTLLSDISYESVITLNFAFKAEAVSHKLNAFGFVVPMTENNILIATTFVNRKYAHRAPEGKVLLRAFVGGAFGRQYLEMTDTELTERTLRALSAALGIEGRPEFCALKRYPKAMVQYTVGHLERLSKIEQERKKFAGLYLIGSGFKGVGIPDCIHEAELAAEEIAEC